MNPTTDGYTGNFCQDCGSVRVIRAGTCELCSECGSTSGCSRHDTPKEAL